MEQHAKEQKQKILGQRNIRKRDTQATKADRHIKSNLSKVNRIKIPTKKAYQPSPRKGSPKKRKGSTASSQDFNQEDNDYQETDDSQKMTMTKSTGPRQTSSNPNINIVTEPPTQESYPNKANTRKSTRPKKETKHYGTPPTWTSLINPTMMNHPTKGTQQASHPTPLRKQLQGTLQPHPHVVPYPSPRPATATSSADHHQNHRTKHTLPTPIPTTQTKAKKKTSDTCSPTSFNQSPWPRQ